LQRQRIVSRNHEEKSYESTTQQSAPHHRTVTAFGQIGGGES